MTKLFLAIFIGLMALAIPFVSFAAEPTPVGCQPLYNGGNVCKDSNVLGVNKKILNPTVVVTPGQSFKDSDFIENIGPNDTRYTANKLTAFRIFLTNKSNASLKKISVKDIFPPAFITFVSGNGTYDAATRTFSTTIDELKAKETTSITIQVMTARTDQMPSDNSSLCTINLAIATVDNKTSQDTSQLCVSKTEIATPLSSAQSAFPAQPTTPSVTKGGLPVISPIVTKPGQTTPPTGPETLVLAGLVPTGILGWLLRKKTR